MKPLKRRPEEIHLFNSYLQSPCHPPGTVLSAGQTEVSKAEPVLVLTEGIA